MKRLDVWYILFVIFFGILSFSLVTYYSVNPGVKDNQTFLCDDLLKANQQKLNHPYLVQGVFLFIGIVFFVFTVPCSTSLMWKKKKMKYKMKWRIIAYVVVGICLSLTFGILWGRLGSLGRGGEARWMSPSFMDTCQSSDLRYINKLCGKNKNLIHADYSGELKFADLNCSASEWIVSFSTGYPSFLIAIQVVLVVSSTVLSAHLDPFSVGVISTILILGMGMAAMAPNEAYFSTILCSYLLGIIASVVSGILFGFSYAFDYESRRGQLPYSTKDLPPKELQAPEAPGSPSVMTN